jgi:hypothetical protein
MKTTLITLIAAIALTQAVNARDWMWFHGDIGVNSPFSSSSSSEANTASTPHTAKPKALSKRPVTKSKSKSTGRRITAR